MAVPFVDLQRHHAPLREELREAFERVSTSGGFVLGEEVERFEAEFAAFCGAAECIGVSSGTAALGLALRAAGIGEGDEVVVPAHTYIASALGVVHAGARPVYCDVDRGTGLIDPAAAAAAIGPRTAAILPVHLYGQTCDMAALSELARRHGLLVVEDAAQAHGATYGAARAGSLGAAGCFSFYPSKNLGALGDGGAICTDDPEIARRARELRNLGQRTKNDHASLGFNERLDGLQAAFLSVKLRHLDAGNAARRARAATYRRALAAAVGLLDERGDGECVFHVFPIRVADRDRMAESLRAAGVHTGVHYPRILPEHPPLADPDQPPEAFPVALGWARDELSLPMFAELTDDEVEQVVEACLPVYKAA